MHQVARKHALACFFKSLGLDDDLVDKYTSISIKEGVDVDTYKMWASQVKDRGNIQLMNKLGIPVGVQYKIHFYFYPGECPWSMFYIFAYFLFETLLTSL